MFLRTTTSVLAVVACAAPALAEVTPSEVWQNWVEYYKANGYTVTEGARDEAGETLTLRDVVVGYAQPDEGTRVEFRTPEITMTATGDGRVRTTLAETSPVTATFRDSEGGQVTLNGSLVARDTEIVSGGTAADMTHESRSGELTLALQTVQTAEGTREVPASVKLVNATSRQQITDAEMMRFDATMSADRMEIAADYADPEGTEAPGRIKVNGSLENLQATSAGSLPKDVDITQAMHTALRAGMDVTAALSAGQGRLDLDFAGTDDQGQQDTAKANTTLQGLDVTVAVGPEGLKYQGGLDSTSTEMTVSDLPAPVGYTVTEASFDMQFPVMQATEAQPFKFAYSIGGLTLADSVWNMFDSARVLPRDPASLDIDLTGLVRVTMDLFDPALMEAAEEAEAAGEAHAHDDAPAAEGDSAAPVTAPSAGTDAAPAEDSAELPAETPNPFEPVQLSINKLALAAAGASLDASGELSVPEGGNPEQPVGQVQARFEGVNGLLDRLVQMGAISQDEVAGYRMMLALFARPAPEGGDALVGQFEFREGGQIFANGQQVK
ncbi:DUF2125 domain-containing protein [Paracoccus chinensis]|uniref:DUF2125 domain-containing protein n=1 Tax=Paracoccus chinensis TaxID=525640 RepID=A0A1G9CA74_9RHOB|nr:DUF2125 domain-containing protein [Paracoccus chinensis]SDK48265.1 hypothetical protein SAMN04487971_101143 [Paracoccus chinensis]